MSGGTKRNAPGDDAGSRAAAPAGSSRIRVVGLPAKVCPKVLKAHFGACGEVTDCAVILNPQNGRPRMAFLGFKTEPEAEKAVRSLNNSYYNTSKLTVEIARQIGDAAAERKAWSRHTKRKVEERDQKLAAEKKQAESVKAAADAARLRAEETLRKKAEAKKDRGLRNFMEAAKGTASRKIWENDMEDAGAHAADDSDDGAMRDDGDDDDAVSVASIDSEQQRTRQEKLNTMSDLDFFRSKQKPLAEQAKEEGGGGDGDEATTSAAVAGGTAGSAPAAVAKKKKPKRAKTAYVIDSTGRVAPGGAACVTLPEEGYSHGMRQKKSDEEIIDEVMESGRLFLRNLSYTATEEEVRALCEEYGVVTESHIPLTRDTHQSKGVAFVQFAIPEQAVEAFRSIRGRIFQGRVVSADAATANPHDVTEESEAKSSFKKLKEMKEKAEQANPNRWNSLFMSGDAVAGALASRLKVEKGSLIDKNTGDVATRLAMGEAHLTTEVRDIFGDEGLDLSALADENRTRKRSDRVILVKNLPKDTQVRDLTALFSGFGALEKVVAPKEATIALMCFVTAQEAKVAFRKLAFRPFNKIPLFLEWAPVGALKDDADIEEATPVPREKKHDSADDERAVALAAAATAAAPAKADADEDIFEDSHTLYITNVAFSIQQEDFERFVKSVVAGDAERINSIRLNTAKGYGFVQFDSTKAAKRALAALKGQSLMQRAINVEFTKSDKMGGKAVAVEGCPDGHDPLKLTVKNLPFEAKREDVAKLFEAFSQVKSVRLPRKAAGERGAGGSKRPHRGFAFVEFTTPQEAANARKKLANTHLYGRHLVLEYAKLDDAVGSSALKERTEG